MSAIKRSVTELLAMTGKLAELKLETHISIDPTQIGHQVNEEMCRDNARTIAQEIKRVRASAVVTSGDLLMLDMEDSSVTTATLALYELLRRESLPAAVTLQAYFLRSGDDLKRIVQSGGAVRLVKGAFAESDDIAFTGQSEIDRNYLRLAKFMLSEEARTTGFYPAFATHDAGVIDEVVKAASRGARSRESTSSKYSMVRVGTSKRSLFKADSGCGCISRLEETGGHMRYDGLARVYAT